MGVSNLYRPLGLRSRLRENCYRRVNVGDERSLAHTLTVMRTLNPYYELYETQYSMDPLVRWLQDDENVTDMDTGTSSNSTTNSSSTCDDLAGSNDSVDLRNTMRLYGSIFLVFITIFCHVRRRYPKVYNLRSYLPDLGTDLANDPRGGISWMWKLFGITDIEMMEECGMDAVCYARVLEFGMRLAIVGILNSLWLIPVYATADESALTACITDWVVSISISHIPTGSKRYIAAVIGAYSIFGYTMYAILQEFSWFSRYRHQFLSKKRARNYAVYVQCIPVEYRTNKRLLQFFQEANSQGAVLDAHLAVQVPNLQNKVALRAKEVARLERAINMEDIRGVIPTHGVRIPGLTNSQASLTQMLTRKVNDLNQEISESIDQIHRQAQGLPLFPITTSTSLPVIAEHISLDVPTQNLMSSGSFINRNNAGYGGTDDRSKVSYLSVDATGRSSLSIGTRSAEPSRGVGAASTVVNKSIRSSLKNAVSVANSASSMARSLLERQDGSPLSAGFVTFKSLRAAQAAKQMIQYAEPFAMEVLEAPQPEGAFCRDLVVADHCLCNKLTRYLT